MDRSESLEAFLSRHPAFGGWQEAWNGVPLAFRTCLANELPPREFIGSVRALVLRDNEVLLAHSSVPILCVGGRLEAGETVEQGLVREVAEETGWISQPFAVIGFIHGRHLDEQRPDWGRPAPDFVDPMFAVNAVAFDSSLKNVDEQPCKFIPINDVAAHGIEEINRSFLLEALRKRKLER
jgi:8-oxo-dGTP pyrophosphatase MutT (NUDIX family)